MFSGRDDGGAVQVAVSREGAVTDVVVTRGWRDLVAPGELGHALLVAANNAVYELVADRIERMDREAGPPVAPRPPDASPDEVAALLTEIGPLLDAYHGRLRSTVTATATGTGASGMVRVSLARGRVAEVTVNARWVANVRHTDIRAEALGAFRAAGRRQGSAVPALPATLEELVRHLAPASSGRRDEMGDGAW